MPLGRHLDLHFRSISWPPKSHKLQKLWCGNLIFTNDGLQLASTINNKLCFSKPTSWTSFFSFYFDLFQKMSIWGPLQNPVGVKTGSKNCHVAPKMSNTSDWKGIIWSRKRTYMQKRLVDWTFVFFRFRFSLFTFSNLSGTAVKQYMICLFFGCAKYIEKHLADRPSEIQWPPKGKPKKQREGRSVRCFSMHLASPTLAVHLSTTFVFFLFLR